MKVRRQVLAAGFAVVLVALAGCGNDNEATRVGGAVRASADYNIGDVVRLSNLEVTVHGFTDPFDAGARKPAGGKRFVSVDAEVRNRASEQQLVSAFAQFELKDTEDETYVPASFPGNRISGQVPAGGSVRGSVIFEVPEGSRNFRVVFKNLEYGSSATIGVS